jgi:hypothetical protein
VNKIVQLIIVGGGPSIKEGIEKGLWDKLNSRFVIGTNYSYRYFNATFQTYVDRPFFEEEIKKEKFKNLPLIIGKEHYVVKQYPNNVIPLKTGIKYSRNLNCGVYKASLVGLFALSLGIYLLDEGEIYLLGFDQGGVEKDNKGRVITHFYQGEIEHRGIGKVNYYYSDKRAERDFGVYQNETKCKIYNVSLISKINLFPKLGYSEFFEKLDNNQYNQNELREFVKKKLKKGEYNG